MESCQGGGCKGALLIWSLLLHFLFPLLQLQWMNLQQLLTPKQKVSGGALPAGLAVASEVVLCPMAGDSPQQWGNF